MTVRENDERRPEAVLPGHDSLAALFRGQGWHAVGLGLLVPAAIVLGRPTLDGSTWGGLSDRTWFALSLAVPIAHQVLVWWVWRLQLGWGTWSRWFGRHDLAVWGMAFLPLLLARPVAILGLALADRGSLGLPRPVGISLAIALLIPSLATLVTVARDFGVARAIGGDHFRVSYRSMPFVRRGMFRLSSNAMYVFAFLGLWAIALLADSRTALVAAAFQHAYIGVHLISTEAPDIERIYAPRNGGEGTPAEPTR